MIGFEETRYLLLDINVKLSSMAETEVLTAADAIGSTPKSRTGFIIINPIAWHKAAKIPNIIPRYKDPSIDSHLCEFSLLAPYAIAITTPIKTVKHPINSIKVMFCFKKKIFSKIVNGAAKANRILFLLGPIFCKAINNKVSPKKTPIMPERMIIFNKSSSIVFHVSIAVV